ncbi:prolyl-tRNA synthetase associated domain-containing protein 1-like [Xyrauchen texanus]|uniref:prolyl-tRNA synthetase associated domain-containing protein 1-like n=1 Tax=Xyrauchen texanus TaxID=154827 RepID=UPI002242063A|nr:prolyl-tRNA synthetase associated domain-containing protein 1-like [Xyrauchen texanus]
MSKIEATPTATDVLCSRTGRSNLDRYQTWAFRNRTGDLEMAEQQCKGLVLSQVSVCVKGKKWNLWLLSARHDRRLNLGDVAKRLGISAGNLAEDSLMLKKLRVAMGCATSLSLFCDQHQSVTMLLDSDLTTGGRDRVYFHPVTNSATMGLKLEDLLKFLKETNLLPIILNFD